MRGRPAHQGELHVVRDPVVIVELVAVQEEPLRIRWSVSETVNVLNSLTNTYIHGI